MLRGPPDYFSLFSLPNTKYMLEIYKFGGASVRDAKGIENVGQIIARNRPGQLVVVVSAMDKTTNELEKLAQLATSGNEADTLAQLTRIRTFHHKELDALGLSNEKATLEQLNGYLEELQRTVQGILLLRDFPNRIYDRIMAYGELMSSTLLAAHLNRKGLPVTWVDARTLIQTDSSWKQAEVIWPITRHQVSQQLPKLLEQGRVVVTQGYIGRTSDGHTTTLGREGSDYTASILGNLLGAARVTIWKDVPGVMSGDPKKYAQAEKLDHLTYEQAVEMTFYGASVIHPKTIKPLQNAGIPLWVKSFVQPAAPGTEIGPHSETPHLPPLHITKGKQALITLQPRDLSFMDAPVVRRVFNEAYTNGLSVNLVQTSAISLTLCVDERPEKINDFTALLSTDFKILEERGLTLETLLYVGDMQPEPTVHPRLTQRQGPHIHWVG